MGLLGMFARKTAVTLGRVGAQKNVSEANSFDNLAKSSNHHPRTKEEVAVMTLLENTKGGARSGSSPYLFLLYSNSRMGLMLLPLAESAKAWWIWSKG